MDDLFSFQFCLRDLFEKNEDASCYARFIHVKGALALEQFQFVRSFHIHEREGSKWLSVSGSIKIDAEEREFSHRMKKITRVENCPSAKAPFSCIGCT